MPTDCSVLRTPTILPNIRISWDYHPTFPADLPVVSCGISRIPAAGICGVSAGIEKGKADFADSTHTAGVCGMHSFPGQRRTALYAAGDDNASAKSDMVCLSGKRICCRKRGEIK